MKRSPTQILKQLKSSDPRDRTVALVLIGRSRLSVLSKEVVQVLEADADPDVRAMAAWTLDLLGLADTIPALLTALYDPYFGVRSNAGWALVHLAHRLFPQLVLPELIDILQDEAHADARQMAYLVLIRIGGREARQAIELYWK